MINYITEHQYHTQKMILDTTFMAESSQSRYNKPIWFTKNIENRKKAQEFACTCSLCTYSTFKTETLNLYNRSGLNLANTQLITRDIILQATTIIEDHIYMISQIPKLESLVGNFISSHDIFADINSLPLPTSLKGKLQKKEYTKFIMDFEMNNDNIVTSFLDKSFPNLLWTHGGKYLMTVWNHPSRLELDRNF